VQFVVQIYENSKAASESFEFESLESAIEFCLSKKSGFDVIQVNESWVKLISKIGYRIKVVTNRNQVTIAEGIHDYWFGDLNDIDAAIEELTSRDCDWELVYYVSNDRGVENFESNEDLDDEQDDEDSLIGSSDSSHGRKERVQDIVPIPKAVPDVSALTAEFKGESGRTEIVRRVAALWEEAIEEDLANSGDVSFNAFLGAQYSLASLAGQCKITEEGFRIVELAFGELLLLVRDLDDDSDDEDDEDDE
jgi:hypothetical protein